MAVVPVCSLCKPVETLNRFLEYKKKPFLKWAIIVVLFLEWLSLYLAYKFPPPENLKFDFYTMKVYPLLTQLVLFLVFFSFFLWKDRLHFCVRKSATTFYLSLYYLFGFISILFCLSASVCYQIVSIGFLTVSTYLFLASWKNISIK